MTTFADRTNRFPGLLLTALAWMGCHAQVLPDAPAFAPVHDTASHTVAIRAGATGRPVSFDALLAELAAADIVLLGERHDNPKHHRLQARLVTALAERGRRPAVAFEMIPSDRQGDVDASRAEFPQSVSAIAAAVAWERSGWPPFALYAPVFTAAVAHDLPLAAADLPQSIRPELRKRGLAALDDGFRARTGLDRPLSAADQAALEEELAVAHCGHLPAQAIPRMVDFQRARDAWLAEKTLAAAGESGAVLIAGSGHARMDWGVPAYLRRMAPGKRVVSLAFVEAEPGAEVPADLPYDFVWRTEPAEREDPCAQFRARR